jgi:AcrR family transcriptional regulator
MNMGFEGRPLDPGEAGLSRREQAKAGRRQRIVDATCDLLREVGLDDLSMKLVAARADVSLSTVYNLFESKQAVLAAVLDQDLVRFEAMVRAARSQDALARIFDALGIAARLYRDDPGFYRAILWRRPSPGPDRAFDAAMLEPRTRFWQGMVASAKSAGFLKVDADPEALGTLMSRIMFGAIADWIGGRISEERLRAEAAFGFAVALQPFATRAATARLQATIRNLHA